MNSRNATILVPATIPHQVRTPSSKKIATANPNIWPTVSSTVPRCQWANRCAPAFVTGEHGVTSIINDWNRKVADSEHSYTTAHKYAPFHNAEGNQASKHGHRPVDQKYLGKTARRNPPAYSSRSDWNTVGAIAAEKNSIAPREAEAKTTASSLKASTSSQAPFPKQTVSKTPRRSSPTAKKQVAIMRFGGTISAQPMGL